MSATATRERIACQSCDNPLAGSADTYGGVGQSFCLTCWHEYLSGDGPDSKSSIERKTFLESKLKQLERWEKDAQNERHDAARRAEGYEQRLIAVQRELDGGVKCDEEDEVG